jgi:hypothetical protein
MQSRAQLKHKLKGLRQAEIAIRFRQREMDARSSLVWNEFFALKPNAHAQARYTLDDLVKLDHEQLKQIYADYFAFVYFQYYKENGLSIETYFDPRLLAQMGLPPYATSDDIRRRFRELAKKYHPDLGGDSRQFIELRDVYNQLTQK